MSAQPGWTKNLPGPVLALAFLGLAGMFFAMGAGYWWLARHLGWWTFSLLFVAGMLFNSFQTATRKTIRERRAAKGRRARAVRVTS